MHVAANTSETQVVSHRQVAFSVEEKNNASISLKTQEGDVVNLSFNNLNKYSESASKTENQDGTSVGEFSIAALSASKYSMSVQGDLNADEMAAIKKMADAITPIAQDFFSQGNSISLEQAAQSLSESMGVIKEVEVRLELSVTQTTSETRAAQPKPVNAPPPPPAPAQTQGISGAPQENGIRNPEALANAVVDSTFHKEGNGSEQGDKILLRGLSDLMEFLKKQLKDFITQLEHSQNQVTPSATASAPQSATQPDGKKTADATPAPDEALNS